MTSPCLLPIDALQESFRRALVAGDPVVVTAPTGSGKSTRLPLWMAEALDGPILVIEPRRVACHSLATYVARGLGEKPGARVGYSIRFADRRGPDTRILFVTPGVALRMAREGKGEGSTGLGGFAGVMVDEFHERRWECDLILAALRCPSEEKASPRLVVTSATIEAEALATALGGSVLKAEGRLFPVAVRYAGEEDGPSSYGLDGRVARAVSKALTEGDKGDVLVFLPGKGEINACAGALEGRVAERGAELVIVHGSLPTERIAGALAAHEGARRVFLSTNVAETSITIPGVTCVVDSGLVRVRRHRAGRSGLVLEPICADAMEQRAGRAGRVAPGVCIRLWRSTFRPEVSTAPEVERIELDDCFLHGAACGLDLARWRDLPWPTVPPEFAAEGALERLLALGALEEDGRISTWGHKLLRLPMSVYEARLLVDSPPILMGTLCDLIALMQARSRLPLALGVLPPGQQAAVTEARRSLLVGCWDEVSAAIRFLRDGDRRLHGLHESALAEARAISTELRGLVACPSADPTKDKTGRPEGETLAAYLVRRWPEAAFVLRKRAFRGRGKGGMPRRGRSSRQPRRAKGEPWGNGAVELDVHPNPLWKEAHEDASRWPRAGVVLDHEWIGGRGRQVRGVGRMLLPCSYAVLAAAGLGENELRAARVEKGLEGPILLARQERMYAGVVLAASEGILEGEALRRTASALLLAGRLLPPIGETVAVDLHLARLLSRWPEAIPGRVAATVTALPFHDDEVFLEERLTTLGVETCADLALLVDGDLRVDFEALFGLYPHELARLAEEFPPRWRHQGAEFICQVEGAQRRVDLVPANGTAKKCKTLPYLVLPPFRGFTVRLRKGSRVTVLR